MRLKASGVFVMTAAVVATTVVVPNRQSVVLTVDGHSSAYPSIAANGRFLAVAWGATASDGTTSIYTAVSRDSGRTFARPILTNDDGSPASLSGEQPPTLTLVPRSGQDPSVVVTWTAKTPGGTQLLSARSNDGGQSFTRPAALPGSDGSGNRGWQATATGRDGQVMAVWLDHRELAMPAGGATPMDHAAHQHGAMPGRETDGVERAQRSKLFFAQLDDPSSAQALTGGVCYCCKTALATAPDGTIYAAWRHVYPGSVRDIAFTASRDGGRTFSAPVRVSEDGWVLEGCPENGPSMTVDTRQRVHIAWPTLIQEPASAEPTLALFYAESHDGLRIHTTTARANRRGPAACSHRLPSGRTHCHGLGRGLGRNAARRPRAWYSGRGRASQVAAPYHQRCCHGHVSRPGIRRGRRGDRLGARHQRRPRRPC